MIYRRLETVGNSSVEHVVTGDYEEVLAIFTELQAKDAVEYHGAISPWILEEGE